MPGMALREGHLGNLEHNCLRIYIYSVALINRIHTIGLKKNPQKTLHSEKSLSLHWNAYLVFLAIDRAEFKTAILVFLSYLSHMFFVLLFNFLPLLGYRGFLLFH